MPNAIYQLAQLKELNAEKNFIEGTKETNSYQKQSEECD